MLIVESDSALAQQVESTLQTEGYETTIASDGFHAGSLLGTFKPSVMFLDLRIPGLSANDVVNFVKKASGMDRVKVLLVSANTGEAPTPGADSYLNLPFSSEELVSKVNELLQPSYA